jgi:hypothetical protein
MPRIPHTTDAQSKFLRAFRTNPFGPPPEDWPSPAILRRWLRRPAFRLAMLTLRDALRFQSEFHLAAASAHAARRLAAAASHDEDPSLTTRDSYRLLHLHHLRQRFPIADPPRPTPRTLNLITALRRIHPNNTLAHAIQSLESEFPELQRNDQKT